MISFNVLVKVMNAIVDAVNARNAIQKPTQEGRWVNVIYVDTLSNRIDIDTETEPVRNTIVITRNAGGTVIRFIDKENLKEGKSRVYGQHNSAI